MSDGTAPTVYVYHSYLYNTILDFWFRCIHVDSGRACSETHDVMYNILYGHGPTVIYDAQSGVFSFGTQYIYVLLLLLL